MLVAGVCVGSRLLCGCNRVWVQAAAVARRTTRLQPRTLTALPATRAATRTRAAAAARAALEARAARRAAATMVLLPAAVGGGGFADALAGGGGGGWTGNGRCSYYFQVCGQGRPGLFLGGHGYQGGNAQGGFGGGGMAVVMAAAVVLAVTRCCGGRRIPSQRRRRRRVQRRGWRHVLVGCWRRFVAVRAALVRLLS